MQEPGGILDLGGCDRLLVPFDTEKQGTPPSNAILLRAERRFFLFSQHELHRFLFGELDEKINAAMTMDARPLPVSVSIKCDSKAYSLMYSDPPPEYQVTN